jgi:methylated-DNA-[protein]-cysteine S-methyltransferase
VAWPEHDLRMELRQLLLASPVGPLLAAYDATGVRVLRFWPNGAHPPAGTRDAVPHGDSMGRQLTGELAEYFRGERREFTLPLHPAGTPFQQRVWQALCTIPFGETRSYRELAELAEAPRGFRAAGQANRRNPLPILIPCHRVIAASGALGGYAGSGPGARLEVKRWLLAHEGVAAR